MPIEESGDTRLSYQGYRFTVYKSEISGKPEKNDSGRSVKWMRWDITVTGLVYTKGNDESTDRELQEMRKKLSRNCGKLEYSRKGFGDFVINAGRVWDANYGPKVQLFNFVTLGGSRAAWVTWKCEVAIPECPNATFRNGLAAFEFKDSYHVHKTGLVTLTIDGYIEIPMTKRRINDPRPADHINNYRDRVGMHTPLGFQPDDRTWTPSLDKRRADFSYVFKQLPKPIPYGATECKVSHTYESSLKDGFVKWKGNISGHIDLSPRARADLGLAHFMHMVMDRLLYANDPNLGPHPNGPQPFARRNTIIIDKIKITDDMFTLRSSYSVSYRLIIAGMGAESMDRILRIAVRYSGLWRQLRPLVSFWNWREYQEDDSLRLRGSHEVEVDNTSEVIVDLCLNSREELDPVVSTDNGTGSGSSGSENTSQPSALEGELVEDQVLSDSSESNFLEYRIYLDYEERGNRYAWHQPLGNTLTEHTSSEDDVERLPKNGGSTQPEVKGSVEMKTPGVLHEVASPQPVVRLVGMARRYGIQTPLPKLIQLGGQDAFLNKIIMSRQSVEEYHNGVPLHTHVFSVEYFLAAPPSQNILPPANPYLEYDPSR